jgi:PilZ domain
MRHLYEKRWIPRQHMILPIHCQLYRKDESGVGWVRDFSSIGASMISNLRLTVGDELTLTLPQKGQPETKIAATVRWIQGPLLGVEFKHTPRNVNFNVFPFPTDF